MDRSTVALLVIALLAGSFALPQFTSQATDGSSPAIALPGGATARDGGKGVNHVPDPRTAEELLECFFGSGEYANLMRRADQASERMHPEQTAADSHGDRPLVLNLFPELHPFSKKFLTTQKNSRASWLSRLNAIPQQAKLHTFDLKFLIVTVPDPVDSHLNWEFDTAIDSVRRAFERRSFLMDRCYFPWNACHRDQTNDSPPDIHRVQPGLALFRSSAGGDIRDLYLVFFVGETATTGVQKVALGQALSFIADLNEAKALPRKPKAAVMPRLDVSILGPMYSGSSWSVFRAIKEWANHKPSPPFRELHLKIVSGRASDDNNTFALRIDSRRPNSGFTNPIVVTSEFQATVISQSAVDESVWNHFRPFLNSDNAILLSEENTQFGDLPFELPRSDAHLAKGDPAKTDAPAKQLPTEQIMKLKYPLLIGRTRSLYAAHQVAKNPFLPSLKEGGRSVIELSMQENARATDIPPSVSSLTGSVMEQFLSQMLRAINERDPQYVMIQGTDALDVLFLTQQIRLHCPNSQIISLNPNVLFTHPECRRWCQGMLLATTYPLFIKSQNWTAQHPDKSPGSRTQFPTEWAQGVFNALLALIPPSPDQRSKGPDSLCGLDYSNPFDKYEGSELPIRPPLWLVTVGNGSFWPVCCDTDVYGANQEHAPYVFGALPHQREKARDKAPAGKQPLAQPKPPADAGQVYPEIGYGRHGWLQISRFFFSSWCIVNSLQFARRKRPEHAWSWFLVRRRENYRNLKTDEAVYQLTYFLALLLIAIVLLSPAIVGLPLHISYGWPDPKRFNQFDQLGLAIDMIAMLCLLLVVVKLALICGRRLSAEFRRRKAMPGFLTQFSIPCGFFVVVAAFCVQIWLWLLSVLGLNPVALGLQRDNHHLVGTAAGTLLVVLALIYFYIGSNKDFRFWRRNAAILALVTLLAAASALSLYGTTWKAVDSAVFAERASHLNSGVSPLLPAVLLIFLLAWRSVCQLKRLDLLARAGSELPFPDENEESPAVRREGAEFERLDYAGIRKDGKRLIDSLESPFQYVFGWNWRTVVFVSVMAYLVLFGNLNHPFERSYFRDFAAFGLLAASAAILINALEAQAVWECGARLLHRLGCHPMLGAYDRLPGTLKRKMSRQLFCDLPDVAEHELILHLWSRLQESTPKIMKACMSPDKHETDKVLTALKGLGAAAQACQQAIKDGDQTKFKAMDRAHNFSLAIFPLLGHLWQMRCSFEIERDSKEKAEAEEDRWLREAEELLAAQVAMYLRGLLAQLQNLLRSAVVMVMLVLLAINSYPFQPRSQLLLLSWLLSAFVAGTAIYIFVKINRDEVLSRMSVGGAGVITWDSGFVLSLLVCVAAPILAVLAMQFPEWQDYFSSTGSLLRSFHLK